MVKMHNAKLTAIEQAARDSLQDTAKKVLKVAKGLAPVEDGDLRKSGKVKADDLEVRVVFDAPHAWLQHERLDFPISVGDAGGTLRVELNHSHMGVLPSGLQLNDNDSRILAVALNPRNT